MRNEWEDGLSLEQYAGRWVDMVPHLGQLRDYASEATTVVEIGVRGGVSTWAMLTGLPADGSILGIDLDVYVPNILPRPVKEDPRFRLVIGDSKTVPLPDHADLVMIDASHTYADTVVELRRAAAMTPDRIILHDYLYDDCEDGVRNAVDEFIAEGEWRMAALHESRWGLAVLEPA